MNDTIASNRPFRFFFFALCALASVALPACGPSRDAVSRDALAPVVQEQMLLLDGGVLPAPVVDYLAQHRVVFLGEAHYVKEHDELLVQVVEALQARGFRVLLLECYHAYDWMMEDYVMGRRDELSGYLRTYYGDILNAVRELNEGLAHEEKVHVRAIDIDHGMGTFVDSLKTLTATLNDPAFAEAVDAAVEHYNGIGWAARKRRIDALIDHVDAGRAGYEAAWGSETYRRMVELLDVHRRSLDIKQLWNLPLRRPKLMREDLIKELTELRLAEYDRPALINMGGNHAQMKVLRGTRQEWLGDYLQHRSPFAAGETFTAYVAPYQGTLRREDGSTYGFSVPDKSPENELFRLMGASAGGQVAFIPLDAPLFQEQRVVVNFQGAVRSCTPGEVYTGFFLLPEVSPISP